MLIGWFTRNWSGILLAPVIYGAVMMLLGFSFRQVRAVKEWYLGLPITQWPAMMLVVAGLKVVRTKKYCHVINHDGRIWFSPNTEGFKLPEDK